MKKSLLVTSISVAMGLSSLSVQSDEIDKAEKKQIEPKEVKQSKIEKKENQLGLKQGAAITSTMLIGGAAAGPLGAVVGAVAGMFISEDIRRKDEAGSLSREVVAKEVELSEYKNNTDTLEKKDIIDGEVIISNADESTENKSEFVVNNVDMHLLFDTGSDTLNDKAMASLESLAEIVKNDVGIRLRLHGHADPRGTDGYNNVLSEHRAINVQHALEFYGVDPDKIERYYYGASKSSALKNDINAYAWERRVSIQLVPVKNIDLATTE